MKVSTAITLSALSLLFDEAFSFSPLTAKKATKPLSCKTYFSPKIQMNSALLPSNMESPKDLTPSSSALFVSIGQGHDDVDLIPSSTNDNGEDDKSASSMLMKLVSSPLGAIAILACVVLFHESGHYLAARSFGVGIDEFSVGVGPKLLSVESFGNPFNLRLLPLGGYVSINKLDMLSIPPLARIEILSAGVLFNLLLAVLIYSFQIVSGNGLPVTVFDTGIQVGGFQKDFPSAAKGLLHTGDIIEAVNGKFILPEPTSSELEVQRAITKLIKEVQATPDGLSIIFTVRDPMTAKVRNVEIEPKSVPGSNNDQRSVGVFLAPNFVGFDVRKTNNLFEAMELASSQVASTTKETVIGLATYIGDFLSGNSKTSDYKLSGPVGVVERATRIVKTQDLDTILMYAAAASINLGVINFVPVPPSDGFQILFTVIDTLWRKLQ